MTRKFRMTCKRAVKKYSNDYLFNEHITIATCTLLCCNLSLKKKGAYHQGKKIILSFTSALNCNFVAVSTNYPLSHKRNEQRGKSGF